MDKKYIKSILKILGRTVDNMEKHESRLFINRNEFNAVKVRQAVDKGIALMAYYTDKKKLEDGDNDTILAYFDYCNKIIGELEIRINIMKMVAVNKFLNL